MFFKEFVLTVQCEREQMKMDQTLKFWSPVEPSQEAASPQTEVARLLHGLQLVEPEQTGSGAEEIRMGFPLVDGLSIQQHLPAGGAGRLELHVGQSGPGRLGVLRQGENRPDLQLLLQNQNQLSNLSESEMF